MVGNMLGHLPSAPNLTKTPLKDFQERGQLFGEYEALRAAPVYNREELKTNLNNMLEKMKEVERFERKVFVEYLWTMLKVGSIQAFINEEKRLERSKKAIKLELDVADNRVAIDRIDRDMQPEDCLKNAHRRNLAKAEWERCGERNKAFIWISSQLCRRNGDCKHADASMGISAASTEGEGRMPPLFGGAYPLHNPSMLQRPAEEDRPVSRAGSSKPDFVGVSSDSDSDGSLLTRQPSRRSTAYEPGERPRLAEVQDARKPPKRERSFTNLFPWKKNILR